MTVKEILDYVKRADAQLGYFRKKRDELVKNGERYDDNRFLRVLVDHTWEMIVGVMDRKFELYELRGGGRGLLSRIPFTRSRRDFFLAEKELARISSEIHLECIDNTP